MIDSMRIALPAMAALLAACNAPLQPERGSAPLSAAAAPATLDCRPQPAADQAQYIVGYGSLMQDESRRRTSPGAGLAHPVDVRGFRRGWFAKVDAPGFSTTYLGVVRDSAMRLNAVIYRVDTAELAATDRREASYCRVPVPWPDIRLLEKAPAETPSGQAWIYANKPESIATPTARLPIVQSYVDIFVSGCLEQEQRFGIEGFAEQCVTATHDWSTHWINDRLVPRRPFIHQPNARQIDALLARRVPEAFSHIRIE
jgi:hypothetical protein